MPKGFSSGFLKGRAGIVSALLLFGAQVPAAFAQGGSFDLQAQVYSVYNTHSACVVKIYGEKLADFGGATKTRLDTGSGFVVSKDGHVITSAFIVYASERIWVECKGVLMDAKLVGIDPLTTMAVVKIEPPFKCVDGCFVEIGASAEISPVGTFLISMSYEMGLPPAPRFGMATGHNIEFGGSLLPTVYLRTSLPSYNGSAGGPVFDLSGNFAGMTIASLPEVGGSFLLPARAVARVRDDIILCSEPIYSWFGLRAENRDSDGGTEVVVSMVTAAGPANTAGFKVGDVILEVNGAAISNNTQLRMITFFVRPGEIAKFRVKRGEETVRLDVVAARLDSEILKAAENALSPKFDRVPAEPQKPQPEAQPKNPSAAEGRAD